MRNRELKKTGWWRWGHGLSNATGVTRSGYLKRCSSCGERIYMKQDYDGEWRPYESYIDGKVEPGEWFLHECS